MAKTIPADIISAAQASQRRWYVPSSVSIAQWALESAWGASMPAGSNNPFGIKAKSGQPSVAASTWEVEGGKDVRVTQSFAKYGSIADAFDAHAKLLATVSLYESAMDAWYKQKNLAEGVTLMAEHYATDPNYGQKVLEIIQENNLTQYDKVDSPKVAAPSSSVQAPAATTAAGPNVGDMFAEILTGIQSILQPLNALTASVGTASSAPTVTSLATTQDPTMNPSAIIQLIITAFNTVTTIAPLIPSVIEEFPTIIADIEKAVSDLKSLNISATIADVEKIVSDAAVPLKAVENIVAQLPAIPQVAAATSATPAVAASAVAPASAAKTV